MHKVHFPPYENQVSLMKKLLLFCAWVFCFVNVSHSVADVLEGPNGPVEFIGLKNWTASKLFEAIKDTAEDAGFHACAAVMKSDLDFSDAAVFVYFDSFDDGSWQGYTVVIGVEDSTGVQYRTPGNETIELPEGWQKLKSAAEQDFNTVSNVVYVRHLPDESSDIDKARERAIQLGANPETFDEVWTLVGNLASATDNELALEVLAKDASWSSRLVATIVLGLTHENDTSWHGLADSLIDSAPQVTNMASSVIRGLLKAGKTSPVLWSEARGSLLALLAGTNTFAFNEILKTLVATEIDPELGRELVQAMPHLILAHVGAKHEKFGKYAQDFLAAISGEDFGRDVEAWAEWLKEVDSDP